MMAEYTSAFDALNRTTDEVESLKLRSKLMRALRAYISQQGWNRAEAAEHFGVGQTEIFDLMQGKVSVFPADKLAEMFDAADLPVEG